MIRAGAIKDDHRAQFRPVSVNQRAHSAQVAFTLFADVGGKQNRALRPYLTRLKRARKRHNRGETCAIIGNPRRDQAIAFAQHFYIGVRRKNRIEMCGNQNTLFIVCAPKFCNHVAEFIRLRRQPFCCKCRPHRRGPLFFLKRRSGNFRQRGLQVVDPFQILGKPIHRRAHLWLLRKGKRSEGPCALREGGGANRHAGKNSANGNAFHCTN